jgi:multisubunit Na+/H+ antiporter MnhB subunit
MKSHVVAAAAARLYGPLIVLFALNLLASGAPQSGVGFVGGLAFALALALYALVFGAAAARSALPPVVARLMLALGAGAAIVSTGASHISFSDVGAEAGLFLAAVATGALIVHVAFGRATALRDADW